MFEEELELEKKESSVLPLLLIIVFVGALVSVAVYFYRESIRVLKPEEATALATAVVRSQALPAVHFHTGMVLDNTADQNYRLLEKAGIIKIGKLKGDRTPVDFTPNGEKLVSEIPGVKKDQKEKSADYAVPLATRQFISVTDIKKDSPTRATFSYTWKWQPNQLGDMFDANSSYVQSFNTWDRSTLIDKYGVNFYHGDPRTTTLHAVRDGDKWSISTE